jgi:hypothetical protein
VTAAGILTKGDELVERGARFLEDVARDFSHDGGPKAKVAGELAEDADFLRRLKPTLIAARIRGQEPTTEEPGSAMEPPTLVPRPPTESAPTQGRRLRKPPRKDGPNPFAIVGIALAAGIVLAKLIDWRGHAHPRG